MQKKPQTYQSFDIFVQSAPFCLRNVTEENGANNIRPRLLGRSRRGSSCWGPQGSELHARPPSLPCWPAPATTHRPAQPPCRGRWGRRARRPAPSLPGARPLPSRRWRHARRCQKTFLGRTRSWGKGRLLPKRMHGSSTGLRSSGLALLSAGDGVSAAPHPLPSPLPQPPRHRTLTPSLPASLPARRCRSSPLFPPSPSRFLSGRRRFGPATPPSPSGCGERHGGGSLNVSGSEAPCREERGRRGPPVAGQVTGTAGAPPAGRPRRCQGHGGGPRGRPRSRGGWPGPRASPRPPRGLGRGRGGREGGAQGPAASGGRPGWRPALARGLPEGLCVSVCVRPCRLPRCDRPPGVLAAPGGRELVETAEEPRRARGGGQGAGEDDGSFHRRHGLPTDLHPFALFRTL